MTIRRKVIALQGGQSDSVPTILSCLSRFGEWWARRKRAFAHPTISRLQRAGKMPLQHRGWDRVGFLQVDAPVFQLVERYPCIGHRAAHVGSRRDHPEIAIQILYLRLAMARGTEFIQHGWILRLAPGRTGRAKCFRKFDLS